MRKMCKPLSVLCAVLILMPVGCDWMHEHQDAVTGAAIGAVGGAFLVERAPAITVGAAGS